MISFVHVDKLVALDLSASLNASSSSSSLSSDRLSSIWSIKAALSRSWRAIKPCSEKATFLGDVTEVWLNCARKGDVCEGEKAWVDRRDDS